MSAGRMRQFPGSVRGHGNRRDPGGKTGRSRGLGGRHRRTMHALCRIQWAVERRRQLPPVTSDLYGSLGSFDRIVAHPPYVPALQPKWIFFSGGEDGEEITRRIVEGLPAHLNDRGVFLALTMGSDRSDAPFERRIREWLGERGGEFDIALIVRKASNPSDFAARKREESAAWKELFCAAGRGNRWSTASFIIQRRTGAGQAFTVRRQASPGRRRAPWEWLLAWRRGQGRSDTRETTSPRRRRRVSGAAPA